MKKYFYTDGKDRFDPFTLEELKGKNISRETQVWFQELGDWKPAGKVPELNEIFVFSPPPIIESNVITNYMENLDNQKH